MKPINIDCAVAGIIDTDVNVSLGCYDYFSRVVEMRLIYFLSLFIAVVNILPAKLSLVMIKFEFVNAYHNYSPFVLVKLF